MATINSIEDLKAYCLRSLGAPLVEIDITPESLSDAIEEALEFFIEYYTDGTDRYFYKHLITQQDIDNEYITLPPNIWGVNGIFPVSNASSTQANIFDWEYQFRSSDMMRNVTSSNLVYYTQAMQHLSMAENILNIQKQYQYNRNTDRLYVNMNWKQRVSIGTWLMLDCYAAIDPTVSTKFYNNRAFKEYCTARVKMKWALAYSKFDNIVLPGGVSIDGKSMLADAKQEIQDIEADIIQNQAPLNFIMG